ncbi:MULTISPECIES: DUF2732 family protein [Pectobacterium]|uniref:DUF2732 family protein n=1 Tax=Pectobacterium TaxID=122277 RepID=UPI0001A44C3F|nr:MULTISPECIES: DUF2732 family protein [Pectobacterium]MBN3238328.1 DUF2732 family protein [Pectobacterium versatile]QLL92864.1 DUF2732 family protein [Pectobacterium carotovorum]TAI94082.1 DUF2732 family protein [Pectobacterium versatile]UEQ10143.1 DUF2732 domain-containing protein [Pectobacterium versatile]WJM82656.1 DUF2732 family protein [Pectobacterium brasiliense]
MNEDAIQKMRSGERSVIVQTMLSRARAEAKADAHTSFSSRLDRLATHAAINELSSVEIIELLRQESEAFNHSGSDIKAVM